MRVLGVWGLAAGIVNITIGGGIFRLPAGVAAQLGTAAPIAYLVCAVAMGLIVVCFAEAGSRVSLTGGLYAYVEVAFGPLVGFIAGVALWAGSTAATAAVISFFADAVSALVPGIGGGVARASLIVVILAGLAALNVRGIRGANRFNMAMTVAKLLPLLLFVVVGLVALRPESVRWEGTPAIGQIARASAFLMFAFLGVESALVPSGEVRDSARTVPRALFIAMVTVTLIYAAVQLSAQSALGTGLAASRTPVADAAGVVLGGWGRTLILAGSAISMFGYVSGMTLAVPRMLYAFGRDGFAPRSLAAVHDGWRTPHVAIVAQTVLHGVLALTGTFEKLAIIGTGSILLVYAACCLATMRLRRMPFTGEGRPFAPRLAWPVPILALGVLVWLLGSLTAQEALALAAMVAGAGVVYLVTLRLRSPARPGAAT